MTTITAVNLTASPIFLPRLGVTIPAAGDIVLTVSSWVHEIQTEEVLMANISSGNVSLVIDGVPYTSAQSLAALRPVSNFVNASVFLSSAITTTSNTFQDAFPLNNINVPANGNYLVLWEGQATTSNSNTTFEYDLSVNGVQNVSSVRQVRVTSAYPNSYTTHVVVSLTTGNIVTGRVRRLAGTGTVSLINRRLTLTRIGA
jgi:hypothetical protein